MKSILGVMELLLYPFYIFPALLGYLFAVAPGMAIFGEEKTVDALISILDPTEGIRGLM